MSTELTGSRPGGRTERNRVAVLTATLDELAEKGYPGLTVDAVAERSGVHKTTLYRRWGSAEGLVAAALLFGIEHRWEVPDTGSLEGDLSAMNRELTTYFTDPAKSALPLASVASSFQSAKAADSLREYYADRHERGAAMTVRAIARGEVPADTDPVEVMRQAAAPVFYRLFISREPIDFAIADRAARAAVLAAKAGAFAV
ncbi:TetR/AcrR family transcriptional regulator [Amycolatopsis magusensis]|uniref:AcrR family transcriptional regulator n=1 Tax=Amycolatopsis magusensis TaxID=882444 RepID=A0ABS4Q4N3_9PSEU|nr:TetR/AcrR family transcriptional regulator [Amycolatopsis magusensis]MBP2186637.1 AcrR family transcriptional regulator [Amycolatopsis magusensis]MDI5980337.1 TetR/AcrR family transcriptional regulator [Amycolatopsis magusensis]